LRCMQQLWWPAHNVPTEASLCGLTSQCVLLVFSHRGARRSSSCLLRMRSTETSRCRQRHRPTGTRLCHPCQNHLMARDQASYADATVLLAAASVASVYTNVRHRLSWVHHRLLQMTQCQPWCAIDILPAMEHLLWPRAMLPPGLHGGWHQHLLA
jgi:hypothetical protein